MAQRDTTARCKGRDKSGGQQATPDDASRKRRRSTQDEEDTIVYKHRRKSRRIQERAADKSHKQATSSSPQISPKRSPERQVAEQQQPTRGSPPTLPLPRPRSVEIVDEPHDTKESGIRPAQPAQTILGDKESFIQEWLEESSWSRLSDLSANIPQEPGPVLLSPQMSMASTSRKSEKTSASVHDPNYRQSLGKRNIFVYKDSPPVELIHRAKRMISRSRASPEMDDDTAQKLAATSLTLDDAYEDQVILQLGQHMIPSMVNLPDSRLSSSANRLWYNAVPVPLKTSIIDNPLPLPKPKPDLVFGYSATAFTEDQLGAVDLLVDDQSGRSYAVPDAEIHFPFLEVEFKSQAKDGSHYVATSQAAGTGAIALNGYMRLMQLRSEMQDFDYNEPQFFSVTVDQLMARINVHWIKAPVEGKPHTFHMARLLTHLLDDAEGPRAISRAVKNILEEAAGGRLRSICDALDTYRANVIRDRELAKAQMIQAREDARSEPQPVRCTQEMPPPDLPAKSVRIRGTTNGRKKQGR